MNTGNTRGSVLALIVAIGTSDLTAQTAPETEVPGDGTVYAPATTYELLYSQIDGASGTGFWDMDFVGGKDGYDAVAADDFIVTSPGGWDIKNVLTLGINVGTGPNPAWVNTSFHVDAGGEPGALLPGCAFPGNTDFTTDGTGDLSIEVDCAAPAGVVWVSQQVRIQSFGPFHYWATRTTAVGNPFVWKNPPNGFATGCTDWTPAWLCGSSGLDTLFEIRGKESTSGGDGTVGAVPALGPLGIGFLLLTLGCGAGYVIVRGRARV